MSVVETYFEIRRELEHHSNPQGLPLPPAISKDGLGLVAAILTVAELIRLQTWQVSD